MMKLKGVFFFSTAALLSLIVACSNGEDTAGVLTETESGNTAMSDYVKVTGIVNGTNGKPIPQAHVYFTGDDPLTHHTIILDSTLSDDDGNFAFDSIADCTRRLGCTARLFAKAAIKKDSLVGFVYDYHYFSSRDSSVVHQNIEIGKPATLNIATAELRDYHDIDADSICFEGNFVCAAITQEDLEKGYLTIEGVPPGIIGAKWLWHEGEANEWGGTLEIKPGSTFFWGVGGGGYAVDSIRLALPERALHMLDSLGLEPTLDSLFIPYKLSTKVGDYPENDDYGNTPDPLVDEFGNRIFSLKAEGETQEARYWMSVRRIGKDTLTARWLQGGYISDEIYPNIQHLYASIKPGSSFDDTLFNTHHVTLKTCVMYKRQQNTASTEIASDNCRETGSYDWQENSFAVSFWLDTKDIDTDSKPVLFSAGSDTLGFKIAQCENDLQSICTMIKTSADSANSEVYGKTKFFDGKKHHFSLVIYEKHLTIAIDGQTVHDTDLKPAAEFYGGIRGIRTGDYTLEDFVTFFPGSYIRKEEEKDWTRLKAWLMAFYELQKQ
ncbi:MAG: carboxypeptidase regulatory-like domain-containing protein [Fibrobacter sp.]|nr:carboxypeptidase regulatory-like domain-containing protein [Fibrobacter sp.]